METHRRPAWLMRVIVAVSWGVIFAPLSGQGLIHAAVPAAQFPELLGIVPAEGSTVCSVPTVTVTLRLNDALRTRGAFDISRVRLRLDRVDVTRQSVVLGTMDYPQGTASLSYTPKKPLARGRHQVEFIFASPRGQQTYRWSFGVGAVPCPEPPGRVGARISG